MKKYRYEIISTKLISYFENTEMFIKLPTVSEDSLTLHKS